MSRRDGLLGKIVGFSFVSIVSAMLSFVVVPLSTHLYDPVSLGRINFFFSVTAVLLTLFCLGLDQGYCRFYALIRDEERRKRLLAFNLIICWIFLSVVFGVAVVFNERISLWLFGDGDKPAVAMLYSVVFCVVALRFISLRYRMREDVWGYTLFAGAVSVIQKGLYIVSAVFSTEYVFALGWVSVACCPLLLAAMVHERANFRLPIASDRSDYFHEIRFSLPLLASGLVAVLTNYIPQFAIRASLGFSAVSIFTAALTVSLALNLIQSGFNAFWAPYVYQNYSDQSEKIMDVHEAVVMVAVTACMLLAMFADPVFLLFNHEYSEGASLVPFLALGPLCYTIGETAGVGINLRMKSGLNLFVAAVTLSTAAFLSFTLVPVIGLGGGAVAVGTAAGVGLALKTVLGERYYTSIRDKGFMLRGLVPYVVICSISLVIPEMLGMRLVLDGALLLLSLALYGPSRLARLARYLKSYVRR